MDPVSLSNNFLVLCHGFSFDFIFSLVHGFKNMYLRNLQGTLFGSKDLSAHFATDTYVTTPHTWNDTEISYGNINTWHRFSNVPRIPCQW